MKIALLHYHLKAGGVATVVRQQAEALQDACRVCVIAGEPGDAPLPANTLILPTLAYSRTVCDPEAVADEILSAMRTVFGGACDVLHVHNPTLTKNINLLKVLKALQRRGIRLLLQIHDFAEDGRPEAYSTENYPEDCHYAVINSRDYRVLGQAGLKPEGLHLLPNKIGPIPAVPPPETVRPLVLYPIRAIRRKNLGEAILLSLFLSPRHSLGITLPPNSPSDWPSYRAWQAFAKAHHLNVHFELGSRHRFSELMRSAKYVITTSIAEGFGFSFLEPWLYGKPLLGRKLPAICRDFENCGVSLKHLYSRLRIPLTWFDPNGFYRKWSRHLQRVAERFDSDMPEHRVRRAFATLSAAGDLDFGLLDEATQQRVIARLVKHAVLKERLQAYNPFLKDFANRGFSEKTIADNQRAVLTQFSAEAYRRRLINIYTAVRRHGVSQRIEKSRLIAAFLHPPACSLLRWDL